MVRPHRPEAPRGSRGASSWARRVNDTTTEWLAAYARVFTLSWSMAAGLALFGLIWSPSWSWTLSAVLAIVLAIVHGWVGFVWLANPEWEDDDAETAE